jgi:hypothetical protein
MQISNLTFDNYLTGNDRWLKIDNFSLPPKKLFLKVKNTQTLNEVNLILYPINLQFNFNIVIPIRSLMNKIVFQYQNVINNFEFTFNVELNNATFETVVLSKTFIKGFAQQYNSTKDFLDNNKILYVGEINYYGTEIYNYLLSFGIVFEYEKIVNNAIVKDLVSNIQSVNFRNKLFCNYSVVRFLNSLGGYQSFIFDSFEVITKNKPEKIIPKNIYNFYDSGFITIGSEVNSEIEFFSNSNQNENIILADMIHSNDIAWFDFDTGVWVQLIPNSNTININKKNISIKNKLKFDFYTSVNNYEIW